ncbi:type VII secretion integral membrane protein EccD [Kitasatospora sp. NPDC085879]|uniref:type VII secretion integral membrane protein EccD n=1 Tax=Kitasatospora sp. NPDC085879 TaxID=3154769 RepID=UPI003431211F
MSGQSAGEMCRLVVAAPDRQVEVAVPAGVTLSDLLPAVLQHAGTDLADAGLEHDGWVLQRLGEAPLDEDRTPAELGLRDGDLLTLRPRADAVPEMDFDDLVDGISTGIRSRPDRWHEEMTRRLLLGFALAALATGWAVLLVPAPNGPRAAAGALVAALLAVGAVLLTRTWGSVSAGTTVGLAALPYAALAAALATGGGPYVGHLAPRQLLAAGAAVAAVAVLGALSGPAGRPVFVGAACVGALGAAAALPAATGLLTGTGAAAVLLCLALALGPSVPVTAFRLARLHTTALPTGADDLGEDVEPIPAPPLLEQVKNTDRFMTALFVALGALCTICLIRLGHAPGWAPPVLCAIACLVLLLRSRVLLGAWQRLAALVPGVLGLVLLATREAAPSPTPQRLVVELGALVLLAVVMVAAAHRLPGRRLLPYWGRAADLAESLTALSLVPVLCQVLGLYGYLRGLFG